MPDNMNPLEALLRSQRAALRKASEAYQKLRTATEGSPQEAVNQVAATFGALREFAGTTAQPAARFLESQRELAETLATLASLQRQSAELLERMSAHHAAAISALETVMSPALNMAEGLRPKRTDS